MSFVFFLLVEILDVLNLRVISVRESRNIWENCFPSFYNSTTNQIFCRFIDSWFERYLLCPYSFPLFDLAMYILTLFFACMFCILISIRMSCYRYLVWTFIIASEEYIFPLRFAFAFISSLFSSSCFRIFSFFLERVFDMIVDLILVAYTIFLIVITNRRTSIVEHQCSGQDFIPSSATLAVGRCSRTLLLSISIFDSIFKKYFCAELFVGLFGRISLYWSLYSRNVFASLCERFPGMLAICLV